MKTEALIQEKINELESIVNNCVEKNHLGSAMIDYIEWILIVRKSLRWVISNKEDVGDDDYAKKMKTLLALYTFKQDKSLLEL